MPLRHSISTWTSTRHTVRDGAVAAVRPPPPDTAPRSRGGRHVVATVAGRDRRDDAQPAAPSVTERGRRLALAQTQVLQAIRRFSHVTLLAGTATAVAAVATQGRGAPVLQVGAWLALAVLTAWALRRSVRSVRSGSGSGSLAVPVLVLPLVTYAWLPWIVEPALRPPVALLSCMVGALQMSACAALHPLAWIGAMLVPLFAIGAVVAGGPPPGELPAWLLVAPLASVICAAATQLRRRSWLRATGEEIDASLQAAHLATALDAERRRAQDMSRFLAIASHDLRQPVHALALFSATLERRLEGSADETLARNQSRAVESLERSFNALFDISKLDAGTVEPSIEAFALRDVFRRLQMRFGGQAELAGLGLRLSPGGRRVVSDVQLLERILANLVHNALKHTSDGGVAVVARRGPPGCVHIEIWDTGCGIAPAELPLIFREFYQIDGRQRARVGRSMGMGLAIVKRLVNLLGHGLEIASTPGRGTMIRIVLPEAPPVTAGTDSSEPDTRPLPIETTRVVLVIDDDESIREGLRVLLQEWGLHVVTAGDATQAEQMAIGLEGAIDLVLTDLHLGDGPDGLSALASVRRVADRRIPAIVITGDLAQAGIGPAAAGAATLAVRGGATLDDPVLIKPVQPGRLFEVLRASLQ